MKKLIPVHLPPAPSLYDDPFRDFEDPFAKQDEDEMYRTLAEIMCKQGQTVEEVEARIRRNNAKR